MRKKILTVLLALLLMLTFSSVVVAKDSNVNTGAGSITINGLTNDKSYEIYRIFDLTGDSNYDSVIYTLNANWVDFFTGSGAGAGYLVEKTNDNASTYNGYAVLIYNSTSYFININENNVSEFAQTALTYAAALTKDDGHYTVNVNNVTSYKFDEIALGYYLVYPQGAADIESSNASICSLTNTLPDAEVSPKATYPEIDKTVDDQTVEIGQTVYYTITGKVPDTTGYTKYTWQVSDKVDEGLTLDTANLANDMEVKFGATSITVPDSGKVTLTATEDGDGFVLEFDMTKYQSYKGQDVTIKYPAAVNENAVCEITKNKAILKYSNYPGKDTLTETPPVQIEVWTNKIVVDKTDGSDNTKKLEGAEFVLMNSDGKFYKQTVASGVVNDVEWVSVEGASISAQDNAAVSVSAIEALQEAANASTITKMTTSSTGSAVFTGLEDGNYYLIEIKAPTGYNVPDSCFAANVAGVKQSESDYTVGISTTKSIVNNGGAKLPGTGGIGTTIFYILGGILIVGAGILYVVKRRSVING